MADQDQNVSLEVVRSNERRLVKEVQLNMLTIAQEAVKKGIPLSQVKTAIREGNYEYLHRHFGSMLLSLNVILTSHDMLNRSNVSLMDGRSKKSEPPKNTEASAPDSLQSVQREIRETTSFWQRARRLSDRVLRRHHTI